MDTVSFVFQDSRLLKMSIFDNVRMGKKDAHQGGSAGSAEKCPV